MKFKPTPKPQELQEVADGFYQQGNSSYAVIGGSMLRIYKGAQIGYTSIAFDGTPSAVEKEGFNTITSAEFHAVLAEIQDQNNNFLKAINV